MKRLILALSILATPALAQQGPTADQYIGSLQVTVSDSLTQIKAALGQRDQQIAALTQQVAADKTAAEADKKTIADLTAKAAHPPAAD